MTVSTSLTALNGFEKIELVRHWPHASLFSAIHTQSATPVLLKHIENLSSFHMDRFRGAYECIRRVSSKHLARVYDLVKISAGGKEELVIVLEQIQGTSLKDHLKKEKMSLEEALRTGVQLSTALVDLHTAGIVHKALNPCGITICSSDHEIKLNDFDFYPGNYHVDRHVYGPDHAAHTLPYISPEQTGRIARIIDYRTDFYALGVILFECLTGRLPFSSDDVLKLIHSHLAVDSPRPSEIAAGIPEIVSEIVMKLLAKAPEDRYQSAWGISADLGACLDKWRREGAIGNFPLAGRDIPHVLKIPQKLYGRESEKEKLLAGFERVCRGATEMMLVTGPAGIGKSALVNAIRKSIVPRTGYFASGKFDQMKRGIPYASLIQAFDALIGQILAQKEDQVATWRKKLLGALGHNGQVVIDVIPELELIIGRQPPVPLLGAVQSQNRFNYVFSKFIRTFADKERPLVIFLDDLQWADSASLKLMKVFIAAETKHLFLIGAIRNNEVDGNHPLLPALDEIRKAGASVNTVALGPLETEHVNQLIAETLACGRKSTEELAQIFFLKTRGNPFFLNQMIRSLHHEKLIGFDRDQGVWQWDAAKIRQVDVTDNVVDFMAGKIRELSKGVQHVLKHAACIGNRFDLKTLADVSGGPSDETTAALEALLQEELILPIGESYDFHTARTGCDASGVFAGREAEPSRMVSSDDSNLVVSGWYKFQHDRVQQAAYSLLTEEGQRKRHLRIGRALLQGDTLAKREERIFDIVHQLNLGAGLIKAPGEREELAGLNLAAGKKAMASAAFVPAIVYLEAGIKLLENNYWEDQYDLALALHEKAAESAYLNGNFEEMDRLADIVLKRAKTLLEKVKVYEVRIRADEMQNNLLAAVTKGRLVLNLLGVRLPEKPNRLHILLELLKTKKTLAGKRPEDLIDLPAMTDPYKLAVIRILVSMAAAAFHAVPRLLPLLIFKAVKLSIKYGNAPESPYCYQGYGLFYCGVFGNIEFGYRFSQTALRVLDLLPAKNVEAKTNHLFNVFVRHWKEHLKETQLSALDVFRTGQETGDLEYAGYGGHVYCGSAYYTGKPLPELEAEMTKYSRFMMQVKQTTTLRHNEIIHQTVLNLMGRNDNPMRLIGECYDEEAMLPLHIEAKDESAICNLYLNKLILCYLFHEYRDGIANADMAAGHADAMISLPHVPPFHFYDSLTRLALFEEAGPSEKKRILRRVARNQKKMKKWSRHAPMNHLHKYHLAEAERHRVLGKEVPAMAHYEKAIGLAGKHGYIQEEALANELAARFYGARKRRTIAGAYWLQALSGYQKWGARAKVRQLETTCAGLFEGDRPGFHVPFDVLKKGASSATRLGHGADLASVTKAVRTITGEKNMGRLLDRLMAIVIENAGARKGYLLLKRKDRFLIEARVATTGSRPLAGSRAVEACRDLSPAVIHYVIRTGRDVLLNDAANDARFSADPYIGENGIRSILCIPIEDHGRMTGVLYLENRRVAGAFTPERVEILRTVSEILANAWARREAEENLLAQREQLRSLSSQMLLTEERERRRIAVDLHDRIGHALTRIMLKLGAVKQGIEPAAIRDSLDEIGAIVEQCIEDTHTLTFDISPPILYDLGLEAALDWLAERTRTQHHIPIRFEDDEQPKPLDEGTRVLLFQASRELIFNMVKHSRASAATLSVAADHRNIRVTIEDDGMGFDPAATGGDSGRKGGFGLFSIQERLRRQGGRLIIESEKGRGARITMVSPMAHGGEG